ncbi:uncharacterized protein K460DRAFT_400443 [Cucurbitaria berberidis CBS 394.84]|uniref:Uncharacterized protein n=1 Tax=Cucurbitaria berberidis CBS 394.84 TaxID=1168544 RepID=A0A9P4GS83_9PLEO|nr:uncharacterized protein K460DRAFT_400443 [Cucurbitaria berberidis CBS 394.84]KAF1850377.1 hypothetical protein K460DRAFT_400443 [Cucurbitaria berberidis CBS 394.84]
MRSFQQVVFFLFALVAFAFAQGTASDAAYDATVYITSTVYRVNTVTRSGSATASVANQTSTISAVHPTYHAGNATVIAPTGTGSHANVTQAKPSQPQFTGAASSLNANAFVAALAAGVVYLVL